ncbi:MAG: hypothetical protein K2K79_07320 [Paramuribaculum sp.]|nr:hypothetical protein [Paramuribaculum sp.]
MIPSTYLVSFLDELVSFSLIGITLLDCIFNNSWKRYGLLWSIAAIITVYAVYSCSLSYNTLRYIMLDWVIELKPFIPFCVLFAIGPTFTAKEKRIIRGICWINIFIIAICFAGGNKMVELVMYHPAFPSMYALVCGMFYYYCSIDPTTNAVPTNKQWTALAMMAVGIFGLKAKFFATFILAIYLIRFYKPGLFKQFSLRHFIILLFLAGAVIASTWNKFNYYFLQGDTGTFDPRTIESFARPVLYMTGGLIFIDHFPFGSGLASFASFASAENYSRIYYEYGISNVHGLSPNHPVFICDAFYPSLAQFGIIGVILFIYFWIYIYKFLRVYVRTDPYYYRPQFITGSLIIIFILVESTTATTFTQMGGMITMCLLGMCCAGGRSLMQSSNQKSEIKKI